ncbi:LLM class flavin-dependent oxidoreductase [Actinorugispora endophytica]|uniref:Alkanesulfonate monooxygenase SsuD/methylene tetrahydromethanopterin reductase-like flavin-dependent oxidoreductase (Luciferase family) n=1 Tax=Actinorugispora endophytica TaxID=1605990 RepID=A0A4R6UQR1_9ACTN|nr:LLM class flavin-dependent oxidoreductase [Actinorugispora endophytica]TDQ49590.1 alkanesulfonate monooxygenase SsuD/methylene tetrahydromethanopterin reductase-like flavin-dependent oxidoreductase (luciferase family) [Actinorugispora endophytica]
MARHQDFQLGLFSANTASGLSITTVPERWSGEWEDNLRLALMAEEAGIDFLLPVARWTDWGPDTAFHESALETVTWATGLLAATSRIRVFATVHTAFHHPLVAAKQLATMDHIGRGRAGLNIVAGWHAPEYAMFGLELPSEHDDRYALAQEWWDVVRRVWAEAEPFDHKGRFFELERVVGRPKPYNGSGLPIINAGSSKQGRAFAARNADHAFTSVGGPEDGAGVVAAIEADARANGREVGVFTFGHVSCRPTEQEAKDHLRHYAQDNADWPAVEEVMRLQGLHAQSFSPEMLATFRDRFAAGHGGYPLVGDPDQVAERIIAFAEAGFAGMTLSFLDYTGELPYFVQEVLPRLERAGIRAPRPADG